MRPPFGRFRAIAIRSRTFVDGRIIVVLEEISNCRAPGTKRPGSGECRLGNVLTGGWPNVRPFAKGRCPPLWKGSKGTARTAARGRFRSYHVIKFLRTGLGTCPQIHRLSTEST